MSDEAALLKAIYANSDDDTPRLVYADWLDEHDQPERAEFIRVECQAARADRGSPDYPQLLRRSGQLLARHAARWFGPLATDEIVERVLTRRGFVDSAVLTADAFAAHADTLFAHAPLLRQLSVTAGGDWRAFFAAPEMSAVRSLSFWDGEFTPDAARALAVSTTVGGLVELDLSRQPLGAHVMAAVAAAPLRALEKLSVAESDLGDGGVGELFAGKSFQNLRELDLSENGPTDVACRSLAAAADFGRLERLALCQNHVTARGVAALAAAPHLARLRYLNLYLNPIDPAGGRAILASRHWGELNELNVIGCGVGIEVAADLRGVYGERAIKV